jgi:hypothetical protein
MRREAREAGWRQLPNHYKVLAEAQVYQKEIRDELDYPGGHLSVITEPGPDGFHLSISHRYHARADGPPVPGRYPTWEEILEARNLFCPRDRTYAMLMPPAAQYVNVHPTTFHLWEVVVSTTVGTRRKPLPAEVRVPKEHA